MVIPPYPANQLYRNVTLDEDGSITKKYSNRKGQVILESNQVDASSWIHAYYIYDIYDNLQAIIPPMGIKAIQDNNNVVTQKILDTWAFLQWVNDTSGDAEGFDNNGTGTNTDYTYDRNGNMVKDRNKGIDTIYYNHLNLPTRVDWGAGRYQLTTYDANGIKLQKRDYKADILHKTIDYIGEFVFETKRICYGLPD